MNLNTIKNRISSDRGDSNSISNLIWISLTVIVVLAIGSMLAGAMGQKASDTANCIAQSGTSFVDDFNKKSTGVQAKVQCVNGTTGTTPAAGPTGTQPGSQPVGP